MGWISSLHSFWSCALAGVAAYIRTPPFDRISRTDGTQNDHKGRLSPRGQEKGHQLDRPAIWWFDVSNHRFFTLELGLGLAAAAAIPFSFIADTPDPFR